MKRSSLALQLGYAYCGFPSLSLPSSDLCLQEEDCELSSDEYAILVWSFVSSDDIVCASALERLTRRVRRFRPYEYADDG